MPSAIEPAAQPPIRVIVSPLFETAFCLFVVGKASTGNRGHWRQAWVDPFLADNQELVERIRTFWGDGAPTEWGEVPLLVDAAGVSFESDPARAWGPMERVAAAGLRVPALPAEEEGIDRLLQKRIDTLAASAERRAQYFTLLRDMWAALTPWWEAGGRDAAIRLAEQVRDDLARQSDPLQVFPPNHFARRPGCGDLMEESFKRGIVVIVPLGLGGAGNALFAFPNVVLAAFGPDSEEQRKARREDAEHAAAKYKLLSDPTRLMILASLVRTPQSITELAAFFELSQPTISVHVKMLREAGLLESAKVKGHTQYSAPADRLHEHLAEAERLLVEC